MASSSNNHHTKPSAAATGHPNGANGVDLPASAAATAYPYYPNPNPSAAATGTAYPYYPNPNPSTFYYTNNPNPNNPHYYQPQQNPYPRRNFFLRRLLIIFVSIFVAVGAVTLIVYLVLRPKLPDFSLSSLSVSNFTLSSSTLSSSFNLTLSVHNPNSKMTVGYDRVLADVAIDGDPLASTYLAPFTQPKGNTTSIPAKMAATGAFVDSPVVDAIHFGRGVVKLDVRVVAVVRFWSKAWRTRRHELRVFCGDIEVKFRNGTAGDGSMTGGPRQCWVGI